MRARTDSGARGNQTRSPHRKGRVNTYMPTTVLGVRFTEDERAQIDVAAKRSGQTTADWVRRAAVQMSSARDFTPAQQNLLTPRPPVNNGIESMRFQSIERSTRPFSKAAQTARSPRGMRGQKAPVEA